MFPLRNPTRMSLRLASSLLVSVLIVACSSSANAGEISLLPSRASVDPQFAITPGGGNSLFGDNDVISSEGEVAPSSSSGETGPGLTGSGQGSFDSGAPSDGSSSYEEPDEWFTYTDPDYGFAIKYPDVYVILPEPAALPETTPPMLDRVRFQDKARASGEFVDREPAQFAIDIFDLSPALPLRDWLEAAEFVPDRATLEEVSLPGAGDGWSVRLPILLAPNEFYFFATDEFVFRLTPLGLYSQEMLEVDPLSWTLPRRSLEKTSVLLEIANTVPQILSESDTPETNGFVSSDTPRP